jgi:group I intron endonuclease
MIGIYKITSPSGKIYIGQSRAIERRWKRYSQIKRREQQRKLESSILKYGYAAHKFEVVHELPVDVDQETIDRYEQLYLDSYKECGVELLNTCMIASKPPVSTPGPNRKWSEDAKRKQSERYKGKPGANKGYKYNLTEEQKIIAGNKRRGKTHTYETLNKMREAHAKREKKPTNFTEEHKAKLQAGRKAYVPTDEYRKRMSLAVKNKVWTDEARKKISDSKKGIPRTEEVRKKLSLANMGNKLTPESIAKREATKKANREKKKGGTPS